jgi:hypothetical protein
VTDQPEPKPLTDQERGAFLRAWHSTRLSIRDADVLDRHVTKLCEFYDRELVQFAIRGDRFQRRAEEAEAKVRELEEELEVSENHLTNSHRPDVLRCETHNLYYHQRKQCPKCPRKP